MSPTISKLAATAILLLLSLARAFPAMADEPRPNFILIFTDEPKSDMSTLTRRYTDEAIGFIRKNKERPFFVYLPHTMPHTRLTPIPGNNNKEKDTK